MLGAGLNSQNRANGNLKIIPSWGVLKSNKAFNNWLSQSNFPLSNVTYYIFIDNQSRDFKWRASASKDKCQTKHTKIRIKRSRKASLSGYKIK